MTKTVEALTAENQRLKRWLAVAAVEAAAVSGCLAMDAEGADTVTAVGVGCSSDRLRLLARQLWQQLTGGDR